MKPAIPSVSFLPAAWAERVRARLEREAPQRMIERLWRQDASLWTTEPLAQELIRQRLGWLSIVPVMEAKAPEVHAAAATLRRDGFTHAVLLGMGGSSLFAEVCRSLFGVVEGGLDLAVLDSTDPTLIQAVASRAPLERTLFIVSSKSGSTIEVASLFDYFYDQVRAVKGAKAGEQFVVITDEGAPLLERARERRARRVWVHGPGTGQDVGGRFSATTYFGMVPAALLGLDPSALLGRAAAMLAACSPSVGWRDNSAAQLGMALADAAAHGRNKVTLLSPPVLASFHTWLEQLVAESTGKSGQGLIPILGEPQREPAAYPSDRMFVALECRGTPDPDLARRVEALAAAGHPVIRLAWEERADAFGEAIRWFIATALLGAALRVNPFDEPNVQESKDRTKALLERYLQAGDWPVDPPIAVGPRQDLHGARADAVQGLLAQCAAGDYVAILSYLPRTPQLDAAVEAFRDRVSTLTQAATLLGYGPRYLHSIGQLHKGGPEQASFVFLTADDPVDVPIPGRSYGFSVLKRAQALGDAQALRERGRRLLRLHVGAEPLGALRALERRLQAS